MLKMHTAIIVGALLLLDGCHKQAAATPTINDSMAHVMEPSAEAIWDLMSSAYNDKGDALLAAKLSNADWKKMGEASEKMKERALILVAAEHLTVAGANEQIMGSQAASVKGKAGANWDASSAVQVQARIDTNPKLFEEKARILLDAATQLNRAAAMKDIALLYRAGSGLDEICDGCHEPFWGTDKPPPFPK